MLNRLYSRALALAASPHAMWVMAAMSFAESSFFPLPPDILLIPMILAQPRRARQGGVWSRRVCRLRDRLFPVRCGRPAGARILPRDGPVRGAQIRLRA